MSEPATNPRVVMGDNQPPLVERLAIDYQSMADDAEAIAARANELPVKIESAEDLARVAPVVKDARALKKRAVDAHDAEKAPHLEAGRAVDAFFAVFMERMQVIQTRLEKRAQAYQDALREEQQRKAREEADRIRREDEERARVARAAREAAERAAEERRLAAEAESGRGRKTSAAKKNAEAEAAAARAREIEERDAQAAREAAERADFTEAAGREAGQDAAKVRTDSGLVSSTTRWKGQIGVWDDIDLNELKPHFSRADVEKAINAYVRLHKNDRPLKGVLIQPESKATFR